MKFLRSVLFGLGQPARQRIVRCVPAPVLRWYERRAIDLCLISYPKCGRTWLRLLLQRVICARHGIEDGISVDVSALSLRGPGIPRVRVHHDDHAHEKRAADVERDKSRYRGLPVVFLVRDPRDVLVSLYFQRSRRDHAFEGELSDFIDAEVGGLDSLIAFYDAWATPVRDWPSVLLVRYEDLRRDTVAELRRVVDFAGIRDVSDDALREAVEACEFQKVQKLEAERAFAHEALTPGSVSDPESFKTRRGKIGGYRDYLSEDEVALVESRLREKLPSVYGYEF